MSDQKSFSGLTAARGGSYSEFPGLHIRAFIGQACPREEASMVVTVRGTSSRRGPRRRRRFVCQDPSRTEGGALWPSTPCTRGTHLDLHISVNTLLSHFPSLRAGRDSVRKPFRLPRQSLRNRSPTCYKPRKQEVRPPA